MKKILSFILTFSFISAGFTQSKTIVIGVPESAPYFSEKIPGNGMVCELLTEAFKNQGYEVSFQFLPLARLYRSLKESKVTCIPYGLGSLTPEEKLQVFETRPVYFSQYVLFYKKSKFPQGVNFTNLSELRNYVVEVKNGNRPIINLLTSNGLKIDLGYDSENMFLKLKEERADFLAIPDIGGLDYINSLKLNPDDYGYTRSISSSSRTMMFLKKDNDQIINDFNSGFSVIIKNDKYRKILEKYYGRGSVPDSVMQVTSFWRK
ncbi:MAG: ABC transporter substrate-binding protein [Spirochaetes bacterium]|nr:ABC transporter substrate-binding protein [Spirochaetota bacterium]